MDERVRFAGALESCWYTMSELCAAFGISRKTGYKRAERFAAEGLEGLRERSRAPRGQPGTTARQCEEALVSARLARPHWGPRKLLVRLAREHPSWPWPVVSTAGAILKRHGLVEPRAHWRHSEVAKPVVEAPSASAVWAADFKGELHTGDGQLLCYPLTVTDGFSRYLLACQSWRSTSTVGARSVFERVFGEYGLPAAILTDGGGPFASLHSPL